MENLENSFCDDSNGENHATQIKHQTHAIKREPHELIGSCNFP